MKDEIQLFNFHDQQVRTLSIEGEPYFVGKDVADILGYASTANAINRHVDQEDKGVTEMMTPGGKQKFQTINESGLYSLILSSKLPKAKEFKHWVASEVLPAIRKHSTHMSDQRIKEALLDPDTVIQLATELQDEHYRQMDWDKKFLEQ